MSDGASEVELFTHPICRLCQEAVDALRKLQAQGMVRLAMCNLGTPKGRRRADELGVDTVPTIRRGERYDVIMGNADLSRVLKELTEGS